MPKLRVLPGGRRPLLIEVPQAEYDELVAELHVHRQERLNTARLIRSHVHSLGFWLNRGNPEEAARNARALLRLADREETRARSDTDGDGEPTALRVVAA